MRAITLLRTVLDPYTIMTGGLLLLFYLTTFNLYLCNETFNYTSDLNTLHYELMYKLSINNLEPVILIFDCVQDNRHVHEPGLK